MYFRKNLLKMILTMMAVAAAGFAQQAPAPSNRCSVPTGANPANYKSTEQLADGRVTFRICAPDAAAVGLGSSDNEDISPNSFRGGTGRAMNKDDKGMWSVITPKPLAPDT